MKLRYLKLSEILELYNQIIHQTGGLKGVRDLGLLTSAIAQPMMSFDGKDLYPTLHEKAAALCYSLIKNHPFTDGNKRMAHAAMEIFLILNSFEIDSNIDEQEKLILGIASGKLTREYLISWLRKNTKKI